MGKRPLREFIELLRRTQAEKTIYDLFKDGNYCAFGAVMHELGVPDKKLLVMNESAKVCDWIEEEFELGGRFPWYIWRRVTNLNDGTEHSFSEIADILEKQWIE